MNKSIMVGIRPAASPDDFGDLEDAFFSMGIGHSRPVLVIVGGAGGMTPEDIDHLQTFFSEYLIPFIQRKNAIVITGGTDAGIMAAIGRARAVSGAGFPLVGVMARDIEGIMDMLEPNHSHFVFCPGREWGDESEWIAVAARTLAKNMPSAAILINGGKISWTDASNNVAHGTQVLVAEGSGRTADVIAQTGRLKTVNEQASALLRTGRVHIANFFKDPRGFIGKLDELLKIGD